MHWCGQESSSTLQRARTTTRRDVLAVRARLMLLQIDKGGYVYVLDAANLGGYNSTGTIDSSAQQVGHGGHGGDLCQDG